MAWYNLGGGGGTKTVGPTTDPAIAALTSQLATATQALADSSAAATAASKAALDAQKQAQDDANAAAIPVIDSESARQAAENRQRKLLSSTTLNIGLPGNLGAAPVGFRMLAGS